MGGQLAHLKITDKLYYEGQILQSQPHGKGRLCYKSNQQKSKQEILWNLQGQFQMGKIDKCTAKLKDIIYVGQISDMKFSGKGKVEAKDKNIQINYQGQFSNGILRSGSYNKAGDFFAKGVFSPVEQYLTSKRKQNKQNQITAKLQIYLDGNGQFSWNTSKQKLEGNFKRNQLDGKGSYLFSNRDLYNGNFQYGLFDGFGHYYSKSQFVRQIFGYFRNSNLNSLNNEEITKIYFTNGDCFEGQIKDGKMHGLNNTYKFANGITYKGQMQSSQFKGYCQISYHSASPILKMSGEIFESSFNGLVVIQYKNGAIMKGYMLNNKKNGPCVFIFGERMWKCLYCMDQLVGKLNQIPANK